MVFSITDSDFLDSSYVKCIHGVAGRGKSSVINDFFQRNGIDYLWATSTNKLKRDANERYGCNATTVCSGLFYNKDMKFYISEKDPDVNTIVIDEILQTNTKIFDWIANHVGYYNIIVMTDMKQMLAMENNNSSKSMLQCFKDFLDEPYVISDEGTDTKRARNKETKEKIEYLYTKSDELATEFNRDMKTGRFPVISYEDMFFDKNDIYITHMNETEDYLYRDKNFAGIKWENDDLIPKGGIANKPPKELSKQPILSQLQAERLGSRSYCQLKNVGSCTRYQGSECTDKQTLYYIITEDSKITNREWYTVVSRCWSLDSIVIVIAKRVVNMRLTNFNGRKIKDAKILSVLSADMPHIKIDGGEKS